MLAEDVGAQAAAAGLDREQARAHADGCTACASRLRDHRSAQSRIRSLVSPVASVHTTDVEREVRRTKDCPPEQRETFQNALTKLHKTVAGQQALTLFESGQLVIADASILGSTLELVKAHERIRPKGAPAKK